MRVAGKLGKGAVASIILIAACVVGLSASASDASRIKDPRNGVQMAALFGESDEEKAARQQHEDNQDLATQALSQRVRDLEETLRQLTGQNEALTHQIQELTAKVERQQKDFEYRLCALAAQQLGATGGQQGQPGLPCGGGGPVAGNAAPAPPGGGANGAQQPPPGDQLGRPPGVLGSLSPNDSPPPTQAQPPSLRSQFDGAMNLLSKAQYDEARAAFRSFADANPRDPLAPQAVYWIGRVAYVQKDYPGAARAFAEVIKKYPSSANAAESMLKLGQSLLAAGQKKEGCTALVALKKKYPGAGKALIGQAASARRAACVR
jgi:tol-pal system protein YbgF